MMMKFAVLLAAFAAFSDFTAARQGYILTSPRELKAGGNARMCLTLTDVTETVNLKIEFQEKDNTTINSMMRVFPNGEGACMDHDVPANLAGKRVQLYVQGDAGDYKFENRKWVQVRTQNPLLTFVQTDKPMYKPGQKVQFRVLSLNQDLTPINQTILQVFIQDPKGTRVMQWKDIKTEKGLASFKLPLSKEPVQGKWKITVLLSEGVETEQMFKVEEYVLPKYEVTVKSPSFIYINDDVITIEVCAKYTYGKPVKGSADVVTQAKTSGYSYGGPRPILINRLDINGCGKIAINGTSLRLKSNRFPIWDASVFFNAVVTESATGVVLKGNGSSKLYRQRYEIDIISYTDKYFKPELPLKTRGLVTYPDGRPASNVNIKVEVTSYQPDIQLKRFVHSDDEGFFDFTFPPMKRNVKSFSIYATAPEKILDDCKQCYKMITTRTNLQVKQWYSPSGSGMQITNDAANEKIDCGTDYQVSIQYLTDSPSTYTFHYQVMARGNIVSQGQMVRYFKKKTSSLWDLFSGRRRRDVEEEEEEEEEKVPVVPPTPMVLSPRESDEEEVFIVYPITKRPQRTTTPLPDVTPPESIDTFTLPVKILPEMSPVARLVVYYIRDDGETVAASVQLNIKECFANKVDLAFGKEKYRPGDDAKITMRASPNSLCNLGVVDKSVHLLDKSNQLNPSKVFSALAAFDVEPQNSYTDEYCEKEVGSGPRPWDGRKKRSIYWPSASSRFVDSSTAFKNTGLIFMTDLDVDTRPCTKPDYEYRGRGGLFSGGADGRYYMAKAGEDVEDELAPIDGVGNAISGQADKEIKIRKYFPETWLWDLMSIGSSGEVTMMKQVPDTITEWIGSAFCTNSDDGFGVAPTASMTAFQPFFASFTLPYSVIRGEVVPVLVTVFNYLSECVVIDLTLTRSADFDMTTGLYTQQLCICADESKSSTFKITPKTLAKINVTVTAESSFKPNRAVCGNSVPVSSVVAKDIVTRQLLVEPEGAKDEYTFSTLVCPSENQGVFSESIQLPLPIDLINGSARGFISVIGDIMGPTLDGLDELLRLPTGCGEQNMLNFAPNIFVMQYLEATGQLTDVIKEKATDFMVTGYQRELTYRHDDGSYSAFGNSDPSGSTWLTAFVVKSFSEARPYISIDDEDVQKSVDWLKSQQQEDNGCFRSVGKVLHKDMKGGLANGNSPATLSAFVLIAMLEAGEPADSESVQFALECLESNPATDVYSTTLIAYAYSLFNPADQRTSLAMRKLEDVAITDDKGFTHWEKTRQVVVTLEKVQNAWLSPYRRAASADVEMTAYALMASVIRAGRPNIASLIPIVQWLTKQRNANGGFSSTQDTVVALQGLAKYASLAYMDGINMNVEVDGDDLEESFSVNDDNSLLLQKMPITVPNDLTINARGTGCALMQANVRFNVKVAPPVVPAFDVKVNIIRVQQGDHCRKRLMDICVKYNLDDGASNMAVVEIQMVSGWVAVKESITALKDQRADLLLKRIEVEKNMVNLYFDEFDNEHKCFLMEIVQDIDVEKPKPGLINVYDYYETENSVITTYAIRPYCGTKEELPFNPVKPDGPIVGPGGEQFIGQVRQPVPEILNIDIDLVGGPAAGMGGDGWNMAEESMEDSSEPKPETGNEIDVDQPEEVTPTPTPPTDDSDETEGNEADVDNEQPEEVTPTPTPPTDDSDETEGMKDKDDDAVAEPEPSAEPTDVMTYNVDEDEVTTTKLKKSSTAAPATTPAELQPGCPMCPSSVPQNFDSRLCAYDKAYKVNFKGSGSAYPLKIMTDLRPETGKVSMNVFSKFAMSDDCDCTALDSAGYNSKWLILANEGQLKMTDARRGTLTMLDHTMLVPLTRDLERLVFQTIVRQRACSRRDPMPSL